MEVDIDFDIGRFDEGFIIINYLIIDNEYYFELDRTLFFENDELARINTANENNCYTVSFCDYPYFDGSIMIRAFWINRPQFDIPIFIGGEHEGR